MRFSVVPHRDREIAIQSLVAAARHGVNLFDTAPSYGLGEWDEHHNEGLLREALAVAGDLDGARRHWRAYLTFDPNSRWAEQVRRRLQSHGG
jgi:diketogulonate reductase-like aldo/keto reductase